MEHRCFRNLLAVRQQNAKTYLCVGLDPLVEKVPETVRKSATSDGVAVLLHMMEIVNRTAPFASLFKPQLAHWLAIPNGYEMLKVLIAYIHQHYPKIPVFLDCKNGDIDRTQRQYAHSQFTLLGADGMNYNGYMGESTLSSLVDPLHPGRALVGLGRTSNQDAWVIQDAQLEDGRTVWELMIQKIIEWSIKYNVLDDAGVVMGAAHKDPSNHEDVYDQHLLRARGIAGDDLWFLIPGVGTKGGIIEQTVQAVNRGPGSFAINSSSGITFASMGRYFGKASAGVAESTRDAINRFI